ncbi:MAG: precorrin-2 C(20)-methyltransferase [Anaerovoracaceae bacterium]
MAKLFGVGVGPGDPELVTLKAARLIKESEIIAVPKSGRDINVALTIAKGAVPDLDESKVVSISMPMTRDKEELEKSHDQGAKDIIKYLDEGKNVAFLTLGDPSIYSTYCYVHERVLNQGYEAEIIPGIPSFCAVSARLNEGLTEAADALHIIPASYDGLEEAMELKGTKVLMKSGKSIGKIKDLIKNKYSNQEVKMVERCGMEGERVFRNVDEIDENSSYFSVLVVKEK